MAIFEAGIIYDLKKILGKILMADLALWILE